MTPTDEELLAAVDPQTRALALRLNERITYLRRCTEEADQEYERGWVDGAYKTAEALSGSDRTRDPVTLTGLLRRIEALEGKVADVATAEGIISRATGAQTAYSDEYLFGYADGLAGRTLGEHQPRPEYRRGWTEGRATAGRGHLWSIPGQGAGGADPADRPPLRAVPPPNRDDVTPGGGDAA